MEEVVAVMLVVLVVEENKLLWREESARGNRDDVSRDVVLNASRSMVGSRGEGIPVFDYYFGILLVKFPYS